MRIISYFLLLVVVLIGLSFASLNSNFVTFNYYFGAKSWPISLLLVYAFAGGVIIGFIVALFSWVKLKTENRRLKSRLKNIEKEVENLRTMPLKNN
ncbi:MAG: LapA family protein [Gammaproteobacteria bacterium]|nr:LapA family protein [Gammaproteobacteria bacterium]